MILNLNNIVKGGSNTEADWAADVTVRPLGFVYFSSDAFYPTTNGNTLKYKISDGVTSWGGLDYLPIGDIPTLAQVMAAGAFMYGDMYDASTYGRLHLGATDVAVETSHPVFGYAGLNGNAGSGIYLGFNNLAGNIGGGLSSSTGTTFLGCNLFTYDAYVLMQAYTGTTHYDFTGLIFNAPFYRFDTATANRIAAFDGSKKLISLSTGTYPSLTELAFVKGVTSAIQTQINNSIANLNSHLSDFANPHAVTKAQVGLEFADNTADADKPVSTAQQAAIDQAIVDLRDGVATAGDTLQKLYNIIIGQSQEITVADIAARDAYDIATLPTNVFVLDDGDGNWALYKATTTGVGATFIKISDPDLLNAVLTASQIKTAYESNADTNALTNALLAKLNGIAVAATANSTDAQLRDRATHTGTQLAATISDFANAALNVLLTGLSVVSTSIITASDSVLGALGKLQGQITAHVNNTSNPHSVTKGQVGLGNADNTSDATKNSAVATLTNKTLTTPVINSPTGIVKGDVGLGSVDNTSDATKNSAAVTLTNKTLTAPVINSPTGIVKGDVGLGNVDNTSDINKPVSTAQAAADAAAIASANAYADSLVVGLLDDRGNWDASVNLFPSTGGSGAAGAIKKGDLYTISVAGTLGGVTVTSGDVVRSLVDTPGQTAGNWTITENNFGYVAENSANKDVSGGYVGLSGWSIKFRNLANTFTSLFQNSNTAARTYTFQDRNGTIADDTDLATKVNHSLATATSDFLVGNTGGGSWIKKTLAQTKAILGIDNVPNVNTAFHSINFTFDGAGGVVQTGIVAHADTDWAGFTITGWELKEVSDTPVASTAQFDVWQDSYANFPPTVADTIFTGTKPNLAAAIKNTATGLALAYTNAPNFKAKLESNDLGRKFKLKLFVTQTA